jgi:hypothetical protein
VNSFIEEMMPGLDFIPTATVGTNFQPSFFFVALRSLPLLLSLLAHTPLLVRAYVRDKQRGWRTTRGCCVQGNSLDFYAICTPCLAEAEGLQLAERIPMMTTIIVITKARVEDKHACAMNVWSG